MDNIYIEYNFTVSPKELGNEILIAELGSAGFESFVENEDGVTAYIQKTDWHASILDAIYVLSSDEFTIQYDQKEIEQTNWNKEWEKNFSPIEVDDVIRVSAPFHEVKNFPYEIIIEPKMSFGTGHHETTHMMLQQLIAMDLTDKKVLDMGCGTGILAIFAAMKNAQPIDAIDIDFWCYENSVENVSRNSVDHIAVYQGDASLLKDKKYDVIIANINRNILLNDMEIYANCLSKDGILLLSGFYKEDITTIDAACDKYNLTLQKTIERNNWVSLNYKKEA